MGAVHRACRTLMSSMSNAVVFWLLWSCVSTAFGADMYQSFPVDSVKQGKEEYGKIKEAAQTESVVDYIFGTDCYSRAVRSLDKGCKLMTADEHSTLAFLLTNCFLDHSGRRTMRCSGNNIRDCTSTMDEDTFSTYQHFFINIYNICIFLENDNFQKQTEHLVRELYRSADEIFRRMLDLKEKMEYQERQLRGLSSQVMEVSRMQRLVEEGVTKGIQEVVSLQRSTAALERQMNTSLQVEEKMYEQQLQLLQGHAAHEELEATRASRVETHFQMFEEFQLRMEDWQQRYQEMQDHLLVSSETLMSRSSDLQETLLKLMDYEAKTEKAIRQVLGRSFRFYDLAIYIVGMVFGLSLGNMKRTQPAGGPVFAVFCLGLLLHRFLCDTCNQLDHFDQERGWLSFMPLILGTGFRVGWLIQFGCVLISAILIVRLSVDTSATVGISAVELSSLSRSMKKSERYIRTLAAEQKKMDAYIKEHLGREGSTFNPNCSYRFASANPYCQTPFQRHLNNLSTPLDNRYKPKAQTPDSKKAE